MGCKWEAPPSHSLLLEHEDGVAARPRHHPRRVGAAKVRGRGAHAEDRDLAFADAPVSIGVAKAVEVAVLVAQENRPRGVDGGAAPAVGYAEGLHSSPQSGQDALVVAHDVDAVPPRELVSPSELAGGSVQDLHLAGVLARDPLGVLVAADCRHGDRRPEGQHHEEDRVATLCGLAGAPAEAEAAAEQQRQRRPAGKARDTGEADDEIRRDPRLEARAHDEREALPLSQPRHHRLRVDGVGELPPPEELAVAHADGAQVAGRVGDQGAHLAVHVDHVEDPVGPQPAHAVRPEVLPAGVGARLPDGLAGEEVQVVGPADLVLEEDSPVASEHRHDVPELGVRLEVPQDAPSARIQAQHHLAAPHRAAVRIGHHHALADAHGVAVGPHAVGDLVLPLGKAGPEVERKKLPVLRVAVECVTH
eukprot:CAMPEP_0171169932 /NCGR_PEP_ID=MMETSP0790-20130122/8460_1 /TAXON_ID=2925 /ORGANISM="Alexandrium catenella, Strain OF101" /LENGTH=418 /DNA_ID=CAMNT_0011634777 /DNA_START=31 /DNA_END=1287 /DNA_ORIENTATION=+